MIKERLAKRFESSVNQIIFSQNTAISFTNIQTYPYKIKTEKKIKSNSGRLYNSRRRPVYRGVQVLRSAWMHERSGHCTGMYRCCGVHGCTRAAKHYSTKVIHNKKGLFKSSNQKHAGVLEILMDFLDYRR